VSELAELVEAVGGAQLPRRALKDLAEQAGESPNCFPIMRLFHEGFLGADQMQDTFRVLHPKARFRFTCWNQYTNGRYTNHGSRIDYFLADPAIAAAMSREPAEAVTLRCGCSNPGRHYGLLGEGAGRCAATANNRFAAASFEGGGLQDSSRSAMESQFGPPHTGLVYMPPKFSDHIAVTLLLDDQKLGSTRCELDTADRATRLAQPHKKQPSIRNFFARPSARKRPASPPRAAQKLVDLVSPERPGPAPTARLVTAPVDAELAPAVDLASSSLVVVGSASSETATVTATGAETAAAVLLAAKRPSARPREPPAKRGKAGKAKSTAVSRKARQAAQGTHNIRDLFARAPAATDADLGVDGA